MDKKRGIVTAMIVILGVIGMVVGVYLLQQRTNLRQKAAVEGGSATISFEPATNTYAVGQTIPLQIKFNTGDIAIKGVQVRLNYPVGENPAAVMVADADIVLNDTIFGTTGWVCSTVNSRVVQQKMEINIVCGSTSFSGHSTNNQNQLLATVNMHVNSVPSVNPLQVTFVPSQTIFTDMDNNDILGIPQTVGNFTVSGSGGGGVTATNTPTPTRAATATLTPTSVLSPTARLTTTPTFITSLTVTPTPIQELPDTGFSAPTLIGIGFGALLLIGAMMLMVI